MAAKKRPVRKRRTKENLVAHAKKLVPNRPCRNWFDGLSEEDQKSLMELRNAFITKQLPGLTRTQLYEEIIKPRFTVCYTTFILWLRTGTCRK